MKILITTYWYKPAVNGVVTSVLNLEKSLRSMGHDVRVLTISRDHRSSRQGDVYYVGSLGAEAIYPAVRIPIQPNHGYLDELAQWKPELIHSQCELITFAFARKLADRLQIPVVHTYHTIYEDYTHYFSPSKTLGRKAVAMFSRSVLSKTDTVIVPTEKVKDMLNRYEVEQEIRVVPSGIDLEKFRWKMDADARHQKRQALGIPEGRHVLVTIGRLAKEKNIDMLFQQLAAMNRNDVYLLVVGDGPYRSELEALAADLHIRQQVIFTGMVSPDEVGEYYQLGDVFVSASNSETQGLTYVEALASGLPAVCRKDPCLDGLICDGENGYQIDSGEEFQQAIQRLFQDEALYAKLSAQAVGVAERYSAEHFGAHIEQVYLQTMARSRRDAGVDRGRAGRLGAGVTDEQYGKIIA